jgi:hypothetical protein
VELYVYNRLVDNRSRRPLDLNIYIREEFCCPRQIPRHQMTIDLGGGGIHKDMFWAVKKTDARV